MSELPRPLKSHAELAAYRQEVLRSRSAETPRLRICMTGCRAIGADAVLEAVSREVQRRGCKEALEIIETGCHGFCAVGPVIGIDPSGCFYQQVSPDDAPEIIASALNGKPVERLLHFNPKTGEHLPHPDKIPFFSRQKKIVLRNCGQIDPCRIDHYIAREGYAAISKALQEMTSEQVIEEVKASGLRGRGGAGFSTGQKWRFARLAQGETKYVICNGDEGDPGAFMDRGVLEGDPHSVIEGMLVCGYAIGASQGYLYVRAEYPIAVRHLKIALRQAEELGLLGDNILGSGFNFRLEVREGAGAFVCGEETALIASIEGKRGMPRPRPPFPAQSGLWGAPTNINNVETFANIAPILLNGAAWYASLGTEGSKGTKVFALAGKVKNTGLVEVPMGITLREIIYEVGGGIPRERNFKAVQMGGPSGGCLPEAHLDTKIDYESLVSLGAIMGSGGMIVLDETNCMVDIARFFLNFCQEESCGKCIPCRIGTKRMLEVLTRITEGRGEAADIELLQEMGAAIKDASLCGLGQTAPNPVLSTLRYFRHEYDAHIRTKICPAGVCKALSTSPCQDACPAGLDAQGYIGLASQGRFAEALALVRERIPLPGVCGRVCYHPCERICRRGDVDEPIAINPIKRFLADWEARRPEEEILAKIPRAVYRSEKVAVIGSGPAGLAAASKLAQAGWPVTVFEAHEVLGGSLAEAIPAYRLPRNILEREIRCLGAMGVEFETGRRIAKEDFETLKSQGYRAILFAIGAHRSRPLGVPGEELQGVVSGLEFLRKVNLGQMKSLSGKALVIGGGNVAIDAARVALRLGAEVTILYRRSREEMPAHDWEIAEAEAEGVKIEYLSAPTKLIGENGRLKAAECVRMKLGERDAQGRRRPEVIPGSEYALKTDWVIAAIGQVPETRFAQDLGIGLTREGLLEVDPDTLQTSLPGVFAAGDAVTGPATVVEAFAAGNRAAETIHRYLLGIPTPPATPPKKSRVQLEKPKEEDLVSRPRAKMPCLEHAERKSSFKEVEAGLSEEEVLKEATRCLRCGLQNE